MDAGGTEEGLHVKTYTHEHTHTVLPRFGALVRIQKMNELS